MQALTPDDGKHPRQHVERHEHALLDAEGSLDGKDGRHQADVAVGQVMSSSTPCDARHTPDDLPGNQDGQVVVSIKARGIRQHERLVVEEAVALCEHMQLLQCMLHMHAPLSMYCILLLDTHVM